MSMFPSGTQALLNGSRCTLFIEDKGIVIFDLVDDYRFRLLQEYFKMNLTFPLQDTIEFWSRLHQEVQGRWSKPPPPIEISLEEIFS